jgi:hypothetical protein
MKRNVFIAGLLFLLLVAGVVALRQSEDMSRTAVALNGDQHTGYDLSWFTVDGGGTTVSSHTGYSLSGTIGQPDAGVLANNGYVLYGGFWIGVLPPEFSYYIPFVTRER